MCAYTHISVGKVKVTQVAQVGSAMGSIQEVDQLPDSESPRQEAWGYRGCCPTKTGASPAGSLSYTGCANPSNHPMGLGAEWPWQQGVEAVHEPITGASPALTQLQAQPQTSKDQS